MEKNILFAELMRTGLFGGSLSDIALKELCDTELIRELFLLAKKHDMAQVLAAALEANGVDTERDGALTAALIKAKTNAVFAYASQTAELERISAIFSENSIDFLPLKGAFIRRYYPEPYMRPGCDIDILVREADLDPASELLTGELGYHEDGQRSFTDRSFIAENKVRLELHFNIFVSSERCDTLLADAMNNTVRTGEGTRLEFTPEFAYFYHIAHMSKHVINGGCGVKAFSDILLMRENMELDEEKLSHFLHTSGLESFSAICERLAYAWFRDGERNTLQESLESFILDGGSFGSTRTAAAARSGKQGGKRKYIISRIFQPYDILKEKYPVLKKHRRLTPFYEVKRWFDVIFAGKLGQSVRELRTSGEVSIKEASEAAIFLDSIGL